MYEIEKMLNTTNTSINYRIVNVGGQNLYIEGIKNVVDLKETEMTFQLKKTLLKVVGRCMKVKYLDKTTCIISGEIISVVTQWNLI